MWKFHPKTAIELFIASSKESSKCLILHNGNLFREVSISHSVYLREDYKDTKKSIDLLQYRIHEWIIWIDPKSICFLLGMKFGYTKYSCFIYMGTVKRGWRHRFQSNWPPRSGLKPGDQNRLHQPIIDRKNIIFSSLHIRLGLKKQFVKTLPTEGDWFKYLILKFKNLSRSFEKKVYPFVPQH